MAFGKVADVRRTRGIHYTYSHTNVCKFFNFQLTFSQQMIAPEMLKLGRVTNVKVFLLVLVYVFALS